jgi:hypothetical protein
VEPRPPAAGGEHVPRPIRLRVTAPEAWGFFLVVVVGIVAGCCVECAEAVQAIVDTFPWHRDQ